MPGSTGGRLGLRGLPAEPRCVVHRLIAHAEAAVRGNADRFAPLEVGRAAGPEVGECRFVVVDPVDVGRAVGAVVEQDAAGVEVEELQTAAWAVHTEDPDDPARPASLG